MLGVERVVQISRKAEVRRRLNGSLSPNDDGRPKQVPVESAVIDLSQFKNLSLHGGFIIQDIELTAAPIVDPIGREAIAQTSAIAREFRLLIRSGLSEEELSVTLYHEILEAASVATAIPPASVIDFKEADFERAAYDAHERWGPVSPANLNLLLQFHGFPGQ